MVAARRGQVARVLQTYPIQERGELMTLSQLFGWNHYYSILPG